jgi:hypothetical protein
MPRVIPSTSPSQNKIPRELVRLEHSPNNIGNEKGGLMSALVRELHHPPCSGIAGYFNVVLD